MNALTAELMIRKLVRTMDPVSTHSVRNHTTSYADGKAAAAVDARRAFDQLSVRERAVCIAWILAPALPGRSREVSVSKHLKKHMPRKKWTGKIVRDSYESAVFSISTALMTGADECELRSEIRHSPLLGRPMAYEADEHELISVYAKRLSTGIAGVYIIRCATTGRYKIGRSGDVAERLRVHSTGLTSASMPGPLHCLRVIQCDLDSTPLLETMLHWIYRASRLGVSEIFESELYPSPSALGSFDDVRKIFNEMMEEGG